MKRFHISISVEDFAASVADYSRRLGAPPCGVKQDRYALWRTELLNFSISRKPQQPAGLVRHIGFEDDAETGFREEKDVNGITWEYFSKDAQEKEIVEKIFDGAMPAQAGVHAATSKDVDRGIPACAGMTNGLSVRLLTVEDVGAFRSVRQRGTKEEPQAFLEDYEETKNWPVERFRRYFDNGWIAGAFINDALVGITGLYTRQGKKILHKGIIWGVYVIPEARGRGIARRLIELLLLEAKRAGLEMVQLSTNAANPITINLYKSLGFEPWGAEPHILKLPDHYVDDVWMSKTL